MRKKILLYHPATKHEKFYAFYWIPYSLLTIASIIHKNYDVIIIDDNLNNNEYRLSDLLNNCLCVGISVMTGHQITGAIKFSEKVKDINPQIPVIWGGPHPTILPEITIKHPSIDILVKGQGEFIFKELVDKIQHKISLFGTNGITFKTNSSIINNKRIDLVSKNTLPYFPWDLINIRSYTRNDPKIGTKVLNYVASQGCPYDCSFCTEVSLYNKKWEIFEINRIINDIKHLVEYGDSNSIKLLDANFFGSKKRAMLFAQKLIEEKIIINWAAAGHPKTLNSLRDDEWRVLYNSNCKRLLIGAESGNRIALDIIRKRITPKIIIDLAEKCSNYGINGSFTFIVGIPGCDLYTEINDTIDVCLKIRQKGINHDVKIHFYAPYPGTPLYEKACLLGFMPPKTLEEWANYDYYNIETPWVDKQYEDLIHKFNSENCSYIHL